MRNFLKSLNEVTLAYGNFCDKGCYDKRKGMGSINTLTPELNPSAQRCLTRFYNGDFASWTLHFVNIWAKTQQMQQLFIQFINNVW
jgi:hypothetical protein